MPKQLLNDRHCIRCGRRGPTPYLESNFKLIVASGLLQTIVDLGCGNGRNTKFLKEQGFTVHAFDMVADFGKKIVLGKDTIPLQDNSIDVILANYIFMFLNPKERKQLVREIKRIAKNKCLLMVELYPAKDSFAPDKISCLELQKEIFDQLKWNKIKYSQNRFIVEKGLIYDI